MQELEKNVVICTIRKDGKTIGTVETFDGAIETSGEIGNNRYISLADFLLGLQGFDLSFDDLYF